MFKRPFITALTIMSFLFSATTLTAAADIQVSIGGLRSTDGVVLVAVFDREEVFLDSGEQIVTLSLNAGTAKAGTVTGAVKNLPAGQYAVVVHHDENDNNYFDTNFFGLPAEGYGFSNDVEVFLSKPAFEEAAFKLGAQDVSVAIRMTY